MKLKILIEDERASNLYFTKEKGDDAGLDLFTLEDIIIKPYETVFIDFGIKCEMLDEQNENEAYYLYPRSSISKTPLIMANSVGIIDKGYRGNIKGAIRYIPIKKESIENYTIKKGTRLFQICSSSLKSFHIEIVNELSESERGIKGFGSSGI